MKYPLEIFNRIITGDLSPLTVGADSFNKHISYLRSRYNQFIKHYKIRFNKKFPDEYILKSHSEYCFNDLQQVLFLEHGEADKDPALLNSLISQAQSKIGIKGKDIIEANFEASKNQVLLEIATKLDYHDLQPAEAKFHYYNVLMHEEAESIKNNLNQKVFGMASEEKIKLYVQNHQLALETFTGILLGLLDKKERQRIYQISQAHSLADIYKTIYSYLDELLGYIEKRFYKYLDVHVQIPYRSRVISSLEAQRKLKFIHSALKKGNVNRELREITLAPLDKLAKLTEEDHFTYQDLIYHKKFLLELFMISSNQGDKIRDDVIAALLRDLNFNSLKFFNYIIMGMKKELEQKVGAKDKIELLYSYVKSYNQHQVKTKLSYQNNMPLLKDQVIIWLKEEINFLKKKLKIIGRGKDWKIANDGDTKIVLGMSVAQLSYFVKILYETGIIVNKNQRNIFRFLSNNLAPLNRKIFHLTVSQRNIIM